nr:immunoglobulin domain-containing protein [uncultured Sphaerochaeta sp.]
MKKSKAIIPIIIISLLLILLSSCSDLLMQLGEHGKAQLELSDGSLGVLVIQVTPEKSFEEDIATVERGESVSFTALVETADYEQSPTFCWYLDGEKLTINSPGTTLSTNTLELDTSTIPVGTSEVRLAILGGDTPVAMVQKTLSLVITENSQEH